MDWNKTHQIRMAAKVEEVSKKLSEINDLMLHLPPKYHVVSDDGRNLRIIDENAQGE